jgi:hypothetical protein
MRMQIIIFRASASTGVHSFGGLKKFLIFCKRKKDQRA